jgi:2-haloalkanoic acid dehalogenase type II
MVTMGHGPPSVLSFLTVMNEYWSTFDCYGTLIDWNRGIRGVLGRVFGEAAADAALRRFHDIEPELQADGTRTYRQVLTEVMRRLGAGESQVSTLADSLPGWSAFPEVRRSLLDLRASGWRLAILSNTDRDYVEASMRQIGVPFELAIVASEIGSYKPASKHWTEFFRRTGAEPLNHVHVAASLFHDIAPVADLGLRAVWINRLGERSPLARAGELADLTGLPEVLSTL